MAGLLELTLGPDRAGVDRLEGLAAVVGSTFLFVCVDGSAKELGDPIWNPRPNTFGGKGASFGKPTELAVSAGGAQSWEGATPQAVMRVWTALFVAAE